MIRKVGSYDVERRENMKGGPGTVTMEHYYHRDEFGGDHVRVCAKIIIPPGAGIGLHPHDGEDEVYVITRGTGIVEDDGKLQEVGPGDSVLTGNGTSHAITCKGSQNLELFAVVVTY